MEIWQILNIEPTKNKDELKKVYRERLSDVNPEDDPEGFKELRSAYEEALRLADCDDEKDEAEKENKSPLLLAIEELYFDFFSRIEVDKWKKLFDRDEFVSLDKSSDAFITLMRFLMDYFCLPKNVWKYIVDTFDIKERRRELAEEYPEDFIDYMISNSTYEDLINYYLFEGETEEIDKYIDRYYKLDQAIRNRDIEKQDAFIAELEQLDAYHPYLELAIMKNRLQKLYVENQEQLETENLRLYDICSKELDELQENMERLAADFPDEPSILLACGDIAMNTEDYDKAKECYDRAGEFSDDKYIVNGKQADLAFYLGDFEKSRDMYMDLLKINHYDNSVRAGMIRANLSLIEQYKKKIEADPSDDASRMEMAWSYYQCYKFDDAIDILDTFTPAAEKICEYNNVKGRTYLCLLKYDEALKCFLTWKSEIEALPEDDDSEDAVAKRKRYEYVNFLISDCYLKTNRYSQARKYLETALENEHEEIMLSYEARCELEYMEGNYEKCMDACEQLIEKDDRNYIAYSFMAKAAFKLDYIKETMNSCEHAISIYPYVSEPYVQEIKVYLKYNQPEGARKVIDRYRVFEIESDNISYYEALIYKFEEENEKAEEILRSLIEKSSPQESDMENFEEIYMELAGLLEKRGMVDDAIICYDKVIAMCPKHEYVYGQKAMALKNKGRYAEAVLFLDKQINIRPNSYYYINKGILDRFLGNYTSAIEDFKKALGYDPENYYCYSRIGLIYEHRQMFPYAIDMYNHALQYIQDHDDEMKAQIYAYKARTLQCMKKFQESESVYKEFIDIFGLNPDVMYDYSELLLRMGKLDEAVAILTRCINELPYDDTIQMCIRQLCFMYGVEGYIDKAYESYMLAISKNHDDKYSYVTMAEAFKDSGLMEDARHLFEEAIKLDKGNKANYYSQLIETILSKKTLFKPDIRVYVERATIPDKDMNTPMQYIKMARLYRVTKKAKNAIAVANEGLRHLRCSGCFYGECYELWYEKALIYEQLKDYEMARMCYKKAISIFGHNVMIEEKLKRIENK